MKLINFILATFFLVLSCMPCADMEVDLSAHNESQLVLKSDKHSHETSTDSCTPFCVCNCCGSQIVNFLSSTIVDFLILSEGIKTPLPTYKSVFTSNFFGSIWQPPQIA